MMYRQCYLKLLLTVIEDVEFYGSGIIGCPHDLSLKGGLPIIASIVWRRKSFARDNNHVREEFVECDAGSDAVSVGRGVAKMAEGMIDS
jgi:hypothetical protein